MATMDRDTFIPLGTSIVKLLLIASGQGALATAVGEGAGLLAKFRRTLEIGGNRAVFAEKIADDAAKQLLREHQGISEADWHVAARQTATLIDRLSKEERLAAGYNWEELRRTLLDLGGTDLRSDLADESARQAFDWVLEVACQRVADCFTEKEALVSLFSRASRKSVLGFNGSPNVPLEPPRRVPLSLTIWRWSAILLRTPWRTESESWSS